MATNSQDGKALYQSFIVDACRNIVHILEDIKSCKPPLDHICELLPRLQPRFYSISSSPKVSSYIIINILLISISMHTYAQVPLRQAEIRTLVSGIFYTYYFPFLYYRGDIVNLLSILIHRYIQFAVFIYHTIFIATFTST